LKKKFGAIIGPLIFKFLALTSVFLKKTFSEESMEEMKGISDGSGQDLNIVILTNTVFDISNKFCSIFKLDFCSGFIAPLKNSDHVVLGKTSDGSDIFSDLFIKHRIVFVYDCKWLKNKYIAPNYCMALASDSILFDNRVVVALMGGGFTCMSNYDLKKVPFPEILKRVGRIGGNIDEIIENLKNQEPMKPVVALITDGTKKNSYSLEVSSSEHRNNHLKKFDKYLISANHLFSEDLIDNYYGKNYKEDEYYIGSVKRYESMKKEIIEVSKLKDVTKVLEIHEEAMRQKKGSVCNLRTVYAFIFYPKQRKLFISNGKKAPVNLTGKWIEFNIDDIFNHKKQR